MRRIMKGKVKHTLLMHAITDAINDADNVSVPKESTIVNQPPSYGLSNTHVCTFYDHLLHWP